MLQKGSIVKSMKGHDAGRFYVALAIEGDRAIIVDGKVRKLAKPKKKNIKHLSLTTKTFPIDDDLTDNRLKKALSILNNEME